ncbi:MAG: hypothetical protein QM774_07770 [Gordonia sp. (in: high G+C Gram-positive bacteria)]|uniref:hypothetical protein n=1 Tax=Gordonia sp. (in: high G+C Gram-positive bacteria) TaxID=84139 RepID=UPI0039E61B5B
MSHPYGAQPYPQPPAPQRSGPSTAVWIAIIVAILAIAAIVITLLLTRGGSGNSNSSASAVTQTQVVQPPAVVTQTEVQQAPAPAGDLQSALQAGGFVYGCPNSNVMRQKTATTCAWADDVAAEIASRGGAFSNVGIYSEGAGTTIYTSCWDAGQFWQCTGRNSTIAVLR